ncbi:MAG: DUF928 domain-containing protein [Bacteroidetes bacterium]|nr:DUF928 domain-containing protein [Bacteroidota bacterium]
MIKRIAYYFFLVLLLGMPHKGTSQVVINFAAPVYGQILEGLTHVQIMNPLNTSFKGFLTIKIREIQRGSVLTVKTSDFDIFPGMQEINRNAFVNAKYVFANNSIGTILSQTRKFPEGEYEYCFDLDISASKLIQYPPLFENCFTQQIQPMTPLLLIDPLDEDITCNKRPNFLWQPPMPLPLTARFRLILTEIGDKQDIVEAITYNQPIINQANIPANSLLYPANAPDLQEGKQYAWQVTVYDGRTILKKSEVWTFKVKCDTILRLTSTPSYRELKQIDDGNFYVANRYLRFSLNNSYNAGTLNYSIASYANPELVIKGLPSLKLYNGLNKFEIDLSENKSFREGQEYVLRVNLQNGRSLSLRFIYKTE